MPFRFRDNLKLNKPQIFKDTLNLFEDIQSIGKPIALNVTIRATHSGYLLNNRVYPGVAMKKSASTWVDKQHGGTAPFNKPVIINHDSHDVRATIGRVNRFEFTQLLQGDAFARDFKNPATGSSLGSGYITLGTRITDPDAIPKILDGRYSTVSTSFISPNAFCSICGTDLLQAMKRGKDLCEHYPGRIYTFDDKDYNCFLISGLMDYEEVSYVNLPAQPNAFNIGVNLDIGTSESGDGSGSNHNPNVVTQDDGKILSLSFSDNDGDELELVMKDGDNDILPNKAIKFRKTTVAVATDKGDAMAKTTKKATDIVSSWVDDLESNKDPSKKEDQKDDSAAKQPEGNKDVKSEDQKKDDKADNKTEDNKNEQTPVAPAKDTTEVSKLNDKINSLSTALEAVTKEKDTLADQAKKLQSSLDAKSELVKELTDENAKLKTNSIRDAARQLAICRINLQKPGTLGIDSKEKFDEYVNKLAKRNLESLQDAIADLLPEVEILVRNKGGAQASILGQHVEDPTLSRKADNADKNGAQGEKNTQALVSKDEFLKDL